MCRLYWRKNLSEGDHFSISTGTEIVKDAEKLILHPDFNPKHDNDIALLKLAKPVKYNTTSAIRSICLPTPNVATVPGEVCHVAGWGVIPKKLRQALVLQEAMVSDVRLYKVAFTQSGPLIAFGDPMTKV